MKNLKCIGGACDGVIISVENYIKRGDYVNVVGPYKFKFEISMFEAAVNPNIEHSIDYYPYRLCSIHRMSINGNKQTLEYLCPQDWDEWEAIQHQFSK